MEKEGLVRAINILEDNDLTVGTLVTGRHFQVAKWVRETLPETCHYYDVWHLAKGTYTLYMYMHKFTMHSCYTIRFA